MFCKKCGSSIKDDAAFCPKCGEMTGKMKPQTTSSVLTGMAMGFGQPMVQQTQNLEQKKDFKLSVNQKKMVLTVGIIIIVIAVIAGIIALIIGLAANNKEEVEAEYSIVGEWKSEDLMDLEEMWIGILEEGGVSRGVADLALSFTSIGKFAEATFTFTPSGYIYVGDDVSLNFGSFSYEDMGNGKMLLKFDASDLSIIGISIPVSVSYTAKYSVDKDSMTIDFFGYDARLIREE